MISRQYADTVVRAGYQRTFPRLLPYRRDRRICCRRSLFQDCDNNLQTLLSSCVWLCEPVIYESPLLKTLLLQHGEQSKT